MAQRIGGRQQLIFFLTSFILFFTGNGLYPLLPHFTAGFGAGPALTGLFLASLSAANAAGLLLAGRLLSRFAPRSLYIAVSGLGVPALLLLALASRLWIVMPATAVLWFIGGFLFAIFNVLTGLTVAPESRGRAFSLLFLASPLAAIFGGGALGAVVNGLGYAPGFLILAAMWAAIPLLGAQLARGALPAAASIPGAPPTETVASDSLAAAPAPLGPSFILLLVSALSIAAAIGLSNVAAFLQMEAAGFSPAAISTTTVAAGLATIPVALFAGSLSDRIGRRTLLVAAVALLALALVPLAAPRLVAQASLLVALLMAATAITRPAATAIATDLLSPAALQRGLPLLEAGTMAIGIASAAGAGIVLERFGAAGITILSIALLALGALALGLLCSARLVGAVCPAPVRRFAFWS